MRILIAALALFLEFCLASAAMPQRLVQWADTLEQKWIVSWYGEANAAKLRNVTDNIFRRIFVDSGVVGFSYYMVLPTPEEWNQGKPFDYIEDRLGIFSFLEGRLNTFWSQVLQIIERFFFLGMWLSALSIIWIGNVFDGLSIRKLKEKTFGYHSPFLHRYGMYLSGWLWVILLAWIISPLPIHPMVYPTAVIFQGILINAIMANIQRRI